MDSSTLSFLLLNPRTIRQPTGFGSAWNFRQEDFRRGPAHQKACAFLNDISECIPRGFCLTAVFLPVGSAKAAEAAGLASVYLTSCYPYGAA